MRRVIPYRPHLKELARQLRKNMTLAEVLLWNKLKQRQLRGCDFDRQRPIDAFIVDFYCKELSLAIEVDGFTHELKESSDLERQERLEALGVRVLRFWDSEVKNDLGGVLNRIEQVIDEQRTPSEPNPPRLRHPSSGGEPTPPCGHPSKGGDCLSS